MTTDSIIPFSSTIICMFNTILQSDEVLKYINLVITILIGVVSLSYTIYKWYKRAKEDGKISSDEIEELKNNIVDELNKTKDKMDK